MDLWGFHLSKPLKLLKVWRGGYRLVLCCNIKMIYIYIRIYIFIIFYNYRIVLHCILHCVVS